jgi:hypothetical protein
MINFLNETLNPLRRIGVTSSESGAIYDARDAFGQKYQRSVAGGGTQKLSILPGETLTRYDISGGGRYNPVASYNAYGVREGWRAVGFSQNLFCVFYPFNPYGISGEHTFEMHTVAQFGSPSVIARHRIRVEGTSRKLSPGIEENTFRYFARDLDQRGPDLLLGSVSNRFEGGVLVTSEANWIMTQGETLTLNKVFPSYP